MIIRTLKGDWPLQVDERPDSAGVAAGAAQPACRPAVPMRLQPDEWYMIARYALPEMTELWSPAARYQTWTRVEQLATEAQAKLGNVPESALADICRAPVPSAERIAELERERDHEVLSFLAAYCESIPAESARWVHLGMTSYDLVDTAMGYTMAASVRLLLTQVRRLRRVLIDKSLQHWDSVCIGRTHGIHAEPTTFGHKLAGFAFALDRCLRRLTAAGEAVSVGTISGSVGTYALIDPWVERFVCAELGLGIEPVPSQVVARDRHAELAQSVALLGACVEQLALELRLLQRTEVAEVEERRTTAYQGSSAMPHKRNPTTSERLCGLARLLRGYQSAIVEDVALWHERDLSHSAVERVALPDALSIAHYQVSTAADLLQTMQVRTERMAQAVRLTQGMTVSSAVLVELLRQGTDREAAYRMIQDAANESIETGTDFVLVLKKDGIEAGSLTPERFLTNHSTIRTRVEALGELSD